MSLLDQVTSGKVTRPRRTLIYGGGGIGKTSFGAEAPEAIFIQTEDGLADIDCQSFPLAKTFENVMESLAVLYNEKHDYETVVIDSVDWLEKLIFAQVCIDNEVNSIEEIGYGKGYVLALNHWEELIEGLDALRYNKNMGVVLIAHARIEKFTLPGQDSFDRHAPDIDKRSAPTLIEWCDEVFFASYIVNTKQVDEGFKKKRTIAIGDGERVMKATERPTHVAKNRLNMPNELPLSFSAYSEYILK